MYFSACGMPEHPKDITISKLPAFRPSDPNEISTIEQALAAIITVSRDNLGLPVVDPLHVRLYKNGASLHFYGYGWRTMPTVSNEIAFARKNEIHIDVSEVPEAQWRNAVWVLAHEYAHTIHYHVSDRPAAEWLAEGFVDWVAAKVLDVLKWQDYDITLHRTKQELRHWNVLPEIAFFRQGAYWNRTIGQYQGWIKTRDVAFLAMNRMVEMKGLAGVLQFLRKRDFEGIFGKSFEEFVIDLKNSLMEIPLPKKDAITMSQVDWKIGYKWIYIKTNYGRSISVTKEVIGEDTFRGTPVFVVKTGEEGTLYTKDNLTFVASRRNGKLISDVDKVQQLLSWPLQPGKEWRISFTQRNLAENSSINYDRLMLVAGIEKIRVPAGQFAAVKIEAYGVSTGRLRAEYWYSPQVKWFLKTRNYSDVGVTEEELSRVELESVKPRVS
jgi:hypothetical protein